MRTAAGVAVALLLAGWGVVRADTVALVSVKDNTLFQDSGSTSSGAGWTLYSGRTTSHLARRGLLAFNVAGGIPAGSTINTASLRLNCTQAASTTPRTFTLQRLLADWGEAGSDSPGGGGAPAETGDATWTDRFYGQSMLWATQGGVFVATASASAIVAGCVFSVPTQVNFPSGAQMVADVQGWLDNPSANFGWLLKGVETTTKTARRFVSREDSTTTLRPLLTISFTPPPPGPGAVPDGQSVPGTPLTLAKALAGQITLSWGASCRSSDTYAVYEGTLGTFYSHTALTCSTGGATTSTFTPGAGSTYYLIVPIKAGKEGSYGVDSGNVQYPQGIVNCGAQSPQFPICP